MDVCGQSRYATEAGGALVAAHGPIAILDVVPDSLLASIVGRGKETPAVWLAVGVVECQSLLVLSQIHGQ